MTTNIEEHIGGHEGMRVYRGNGVITKRAEHRELPAPYTVEGNIASLLNEARFLQVMAGSGWTPEILKVGADYIVQTDVGETQLVQDVEMFRRNCIRMLYEVRKRRVRHGDLTSSNIIVRGEVPWLVDWQEAHFIGEPAPQKQPTSDSALLFRGLSQWKGTNPAGEYDISRTSRRWRAVLGALGANTDLELPLKGKTLLDLGSFQGDFCALAATEGMTATGVDRGGFRSGEDSVEIGRGLWGLMERWPEIQLFHLDITKCPSFKFDVVLLFSTWPYIVQEYGRTAAEELLGRIVSQCGVLFFECQLYGDGPGPEFLGSDDDIEALLGRFGEVEKLVTIPVWGRSASRSVWGVRCRK
jgi:hypothetical protein